MVSRKVFGTMPDGRDIFAYTMTNSSGASVKIMEYGGIIIDIYVPDRDGNFADVTCGYDTLEDYLAADQNQGALIGRYGNRIGKGKFTLNGKEYTLVQQNTGAGWANINTNAGSTHIEVLQKYVVENGLDAGFAYDGDADRCLCVDDKGNVVTGDHILYIYGRYMKERERLINNTVVATIMSNLGLFKALEAIGVDYAKTAVGDKYVYEYMKANECCLGGEQSGHIIFSKYASTGDGILTSLKIMQVIISKKAKLSELAEQMPVYPQVLVNVKVTDKAAAQADPDVKAAVAKASEELGNTGRMLVRESGTEPLVRVMAEAENEEICRKYVNSVVDVIKAKGYALS